MYAGSTINKRSGRILGAHQKIDRLARRHLDEILPSDDFPKIKKILQFEGRNGPDGIKRKSPAKDEPWHYLQPFDAEDTQLIDLIEDHYAKLAKALKKEDKVRASFEAAWLAHAVVDGLTPAHHYPYEERLVELSGGRSIEERTTIGKKIIMPGDRPGKQIRNNWLMWGPRGLMTTHATFEAGVATVIAPLKLRKDTAMGERISEFNSKPLGEWFREQAQDVANLKIYEEFCETGWTIQLAKRVKRELTPRIVQSVTLAWYGAAQKAGLAQP